MKFLCLWGVAWAVEALTELVVDAKITDGLRAAIFDRANAEPPQVGEPVWRFVNSVVTCGYCASVWVAMPVALFAPWVVTESAWLWLPAWVIDVLILHRLSNWLHVGFMAIKKGRPYWTENDESVMVMWSDGRLTTFPVKNGSVSDGN